MKKVLVMAMFVAALFAATPAHAFLTDWQFDPDGAGVLGKVSISEYFNVGGNSFISNNLGAGTFTEFGTFVAPSHDGYIPFPAGTPQITSTFSANGILTGFGTSGASFSILSGLATIYSGGSVAYGTVGVDGSFNGADSGLAIGQFNIIGGGGTLNPFGVPNGDITTLMRATSLASGYWFDSNGVDLSTYSPDMITLGFVTVNGSLVSSSTELAKLEAEWREKNPGLPAGPYIPANNNFFVGNGGQYRMDVVPEPATMVLFGIGAAGMAAFRRKKVA
jgi:hypothetical protein